ncbi:MAG: DNA-directed DNA polymerase II small subunit [Candidatus Thermoplasmatota archaeon]|nr:DNA-directed DNA polymerase II small subunit [Candidatus Thermoplasmatota archaeon]MCL5731309.1 DNA-directed DNA polymerase II small subunit [Candidatus Thermoplasmatota archaeon]
MAEVYRKERIIEFFNRSGILVTPEALELILEKNLGQMINSMITGEVMNSGYLTESQVLSILRDSSETRSPTVEIDFSSLKVNSSVDDFRRYFSDRYERIKRMILLSSRMRGTLSIGKVKRMGGKVRIVGMVSESSVTSNGHRRLVVEDLEDSIQVILMKNKPVSSEIILLDEVVGLVGSVSFGKGDPVMFADEIVRPDIPNRVAQLEGGDPVFVGSISDIHVGSKTFRKDDFRRLISWLKGGSEEAKALKYLILSGDVVDGIGVYPSQEDDLEILNPAEQYAKLSEYVSQIPEEIKVFIMPGNHDSVRLAEPQPSLSPALSREFPGNVTLIPNPYTLKLEKRNVLVYHGMSLNDMVELIPGMNYSTIGEAIKELLIRRHLAPKYGGKTPLIPSPRDYHVIEDVPDIFITGHVHSHALGEYKSVRYVNSSTWQSQTEYQRMMNFSPDPSIMTLFDLRSRNVIKKDFKS